jgi:DNA-binding protein HU-beta
MEGLTVTKADLVDAIAHEVDITKAQAEKAIKTLTKQITDALADGDKVSLVGFGTFSVASRKMRKGRNPQTGRSIDIPASKAPKFKPGKALRESVNK